MNSRANFLVSFLFEMDHVEIKSAGFLLKNLLPYEQIFKVRVVDNSG